MHPGGPFWAGKDAGAWTVPKGEYLDGEEALDAAKREFTEETGFVAKGEFIDLGMVRQASGKMVNAWAFEGDCDPGTQEQFLRRWSGRRGRGRGWRSRKWIGGSGSGWRTRGKRILKSQEVFGCAGGEGGVKVFPTTRIPILIEAIGDQLKLGPFELAPVCGLSAAGSEIHEVLVWGADAMRAIVVEMLPA